ncbi:MAG: hypothetical protein GY788_06855 [bacterium]|nr:hypothetical protein [bacterium]
MFAQRVQTLTAEAIELRREIGSQLRAVDKVLAVVVPLSIGLGTLAFVHDLRWLFAAAPLAHAVISFYAIDAYIEMAYLGGNRRFIEAELASLLHDTPGNPAGPTPPLAWETRIVPDRVYAVPRIALSIIWLAAFFIAAGFGLTYIWHSWHWLWIAGYFAMLAVLLSLYLLSLKWMASGHSRSFKLASGIDPGEVPVPFLWRWWPKYDDDAYSAG